MTQQRYIVIQEWMKDLGLNPSELLVFALVFGFCQDGESDFHGSTSYVADWCGVRREAAARILQQLVDRGLLVKTANPGYPAHYTTQGCAILEGVRKSLRGCDNIAQVGCAEIAHDNKVVDNKDKIKDTLSLPRVREADKVLYGERVLLTENEHAALVRDYGAADTARLIEILDLYLANKTKDPYKSHYAAIRKWCVRDLAEQKTAEQRLKNAQEAAHRVAPQQQGPPPGNYAALAEARARREAIEAKYKLPQ